jgi:hypothetical protein
MLNSLSLKPRAGENGYPGSDSLSEFYSLKSNPIGIKSYPAITALSLSSGYVDILINL